MKWPNSVCRCTASLEVSEGLLPLPELPLRLQCVSSFVTLLLHRSPAISHVAARSVRERNRKAYAQQRPSWVRVVVQDASVSREASPRPSRNSGQGIPAGDRGL